MTQIVRKFVLLSLLLAILFCCVIHLRQIVETSGKVMECFSIRERNGRRNNLLRKCIGSNTNDIISQSSECVPEPFQNIKNHPINKSIESLDITKQSDSKMTLNISKQLPNLFKNDSSIGDYFEKYDLQFHFKQIKVGNVMVKLETPFPLHLLLQNIRNFIKNKIPSLSMGFRNLNSNEQKKFLSNYIGNSYISFTIHIGEDSIMFFPHQHFAQKEIMLVSPTNKDIVVHVNTGIETKEKNNKQYHLHNFVIQHFDSSIKISAEDISIDFGIFNLGNNKEVISIKKFKL
jgi:hypothetical protein